MFDLLILKKTLGEKKGKGQTNESLYPTEHLQKNEMNLSKEEQIPLKGNVIRCNTCGFPLKGVREKSLLPVSYTHLTLPTKRIV